MSWALRRHLPRVYDAFFGSFGRLRPVQEQAIPLILAGHGVLIIAPTGSGKTEAAVAPLAELALDRPGTTLALYLAPTRALINDLEERLRERLEACGLRLAVHHGERKTVRGRVAPAIILTTPESLEVMLSVQHEDVRDRLREVKAVVVDETHQFYGTPRGWQLRCLLERLKHLTGRPLQRICLSATLGRPELVAEFFGGSEGPLRVVRVLGTRALDIRLSQLAARSLEEQADAAAQWLLDILEDHRKVLVFANTRVQCDWLRWQLGERIRGVPLFLHYSTLHRSYREAVERAFRKQPRAVCIATSTLELGVDIGDVDAVAMFGAPSTVTSLLQRLGRGNRRKATSVVYAACPAYYPSGQDADPDNHLLTFVALTRCAVRSELETPLVPRSHSVIAQQLLALCCQWGMVAPDGFLKAVASVPGFVSVDRLRAILDRLVTAGILEWTPRDIWYPTETFHQWKALGKFWGNIPEQPEAAVLDDQNGQLVPVAALPRGYSQQLTAGDVVLIAGRPRLVLSVEHQQLRVVDLATSQAELPRYRTPMEPTPLRVAQEIAQVLTMPEAELGSLPIRYQPSLVERLREWRSAMQPRLAAGQVVAEAGQGRWVVYTFAGTMANLLVANWLREHGVTVFDRDAWRVWCDDPSPLGLLAAWTPETLAREVRRHWRRYLPHLALPPLFRYLPECLQEDEVSSLFDFDTTTALLRALGVRVGTRIERPGVAGRGEPMLGDEVAEAGG